MTEGPVSTNVKYLCHSQQLMECSEIKPMDAGKHLSGDFFFLFQNSRNLLYQLKEKLSDMMHTRTRNQMPITHLSGTNLKCYPPDATLEALDSSIQKGLGLRERTPRLKTSRMKTVMKMMVLVPRAQIQVTDHVINPVVLQTNPPDTPTTIKRSSRLANRPSIYNLQCKLCQSEKTQMAFI